MKKIFITALACLAFVGCNNEEAAKGTENEGQNTENEVTENETSQTEEMVAPKGEYVFVDVAYVISESDIVKTEGKKLEEKGKGLEEKGQKLQDKFAKGEQGVQYEMQKLNEKYQKGLITTRDAEAKQEELQKRMTYLQNQAQKELPAFQNEMANFQEEMVVFNNRVNDFILRAVQDINADKKYKMVINASAVLDYDKSYDITSIVLAKVNELYNAEKDEKASDKK